MDNFQALGKMSERDDKSLKLFPSSNIKKMSIGKNGFGEVTFAIDNDTIEKLMNTNKLNCVVLAFDLETLEKIKNDKQKSRQ